LLEGEEEAEPPFSSMAAVIDVVLVSETGPPEPAVPGV